MKKDPPGCLLILFSLTLLPISVAVNAWMLTILWRWFAVPTFGMHPLSMGAALGLSAIVGLFRQIEDAPKSDKTLQELTTTVMVQVVVRVVTLLLLGWIAKSLM